MGKQGKPVERKYYRLQCDRPGYEDVWAEVLIDSSRRELARLRDAMDADVRAASDGKGDPRQTEKALADPQFVRAWNVTTTDGDPVPLPHEDADALGDAPWPVEQWVAGLFFSAAEKAEEIERKNSGRQ